MGERNHTDPHSDAGVATAEDGMVFLDGPAGLVIALTAQAAAETGRSLIEASEQARKQLAERQT